jgi:hypothetical protein
MQPYELLEYLPTPGDKQLGIATVRCWGKIVLKYKIVSGKDGHGFFASEAGGIKTGMSADGKDIYEKIFVVDSNYEDKAIKTFISRSINPYSQQPALNGQNQTIMGQGMQSHQSNISNQNLPNEIVNLKPHFSGATYANGQPIESTGLPEPRNPPYFTVGDPF